MRAAQERGLALGRTGWVGAQPPQAGPAGAAPAHGRLDAAAPEPVPGTELVALRLELERLREELRLLREEVHRLRKGLAGVAGPVTL